MKPTRPPPLCETHSGRAPRLVSVAGDGHHVGPVVGLHGHPGGVGAGHVEGGGAAAVRALDARPRLPLPRVALAAVDAPLRESRREKQSEETQVCPFFPLVGQNVEVRQVP